jgi:VWFA-related protein
MQDFTDDRSKLLEAIDRYDPRPRPAVGATPRAPSGGGADMPMRYSPALSFSECWRNQPAVPTLSTVVGRLTTVPDRRKTLIFISTGVPLAWGGTGCQGSLADEMRNAFRKAERGNVNIHTIDPAGYRGYADYLADPMRRMTAGRSNNPRANEGAVRLRREFMQVVAENTGGRVVIDTDAVTPAIDRIFEEEGSYYLVGYETSNPKADGKFRKVKVDVTQLGATVHTRSGYWAPKEGSLVTNDRRDAPDSASLALSGLVDANALPVRAVAMPLALANTGRDVDVAVVLTVRLPPSRQPIEETATIVRTIYDADGRSSPPFREIRPVSLAPGDGDALRYDIHTRLSLPPGRHELRYNVTSAALRQSGTVYVQVEVPDYRAATLSLSPIVVGEAGAPPVETLAPLAPVLPSSARDFASGETIASFLRIFQGGTGPPQPVNVRAQVFDRHDAEVFTATAVRPVEAFEANRSSEYALDVPLGGFPAGPYLLVVSASLPGGRTMRRDLVFRIQ